MTQRLREERAVNGGAHQGTRANDRSSSHRDQRARTDGTRASADGGDRRIVRRCHCRVKALTAPSRAGTRAPNGFTASPPTGSSVNRKPFSFRPITKTSRPPSVSESNGASTSTTSKLCAERRTGRRIFVSLTYSPVKDEAGRIIGVASIARDITERKRAEEALRQRFGLQPPLAGSQPGSTGHHRSGRQDHRCQRGHRSGDRTPSLGVSGNRFRRLFHEARKSPCGLPASIQRRRRSRLPTGTPAPGWACHLGPLQRCGLPR